MFRKLGVTFLLHVACHVELTPAELNSPSAMNPPATLCWIANVQPRRRGFVPKAFGLASSSRFHIEAGSDAMHQLWQMPTLSMSATAPPTQARFRPPGPQMSDFPRTAS